MNEAVPLLNTLCEHSPLQEREKVERQRVQAELMKMQLDGADVSAPVPPGLAAAAAAAAAASPHR